MSRRTILALALPLVLTPARTVLAQSADYGFVVRSGADTVAVERVHRDATRFVSDMLIKAMGGARITTDLALGADALVTHWKISVFKAGDGPGATPVQSADIAFDGDSAVGTATAAGATKPVRAPIARGAIPYVNPSFALVELALVRARAKNLTEVPLVAAGGLQPVPMKVTWVGGDSAVVSFGAAEARVKTDAKGALLGGWIAAQKLSIDRTAAMGENAVTAAKADYSAPANATYTSEDVVVPTTRGYTLAGTLTIPKGARGPVPAVVTITGSGPEDRDEAIPIVKGYRPFRQVADTLGRRGIAVLRMDDRGFGASGGSAAEATSDDFAQDIESGLAYLRARKEIDGSRLALVGHSEGGLIAPIVAARDPKLTAIVLMAGPGYTGRRILDFQNRYAIEHNTALTPAARDSLLRVVVPRTLDSLAKAVPWMGFFMTHDPVATAKLVKQPVLILQGATDQQVTKEQADTLERAFRAGGNRDVTKHVYADANHLFVRDPSGNPSGYPKLEGTVRADVLGAIADWLVLKLKP